MNGDRVYDAFVEHRNSFLDPDIPSIPDSIIVQMFDYRAEYFYSLVGRYITVSLPKSPRRCVAILYCRQLRRTRLRPLP